MKFALAHSNLIWNDAYVVKIFRVAMMAMAISLAPLSSHAQALQVPHQQKDETSVASAIPNVPFYSQFRDITSTTWQKVGCGIASLAMVIDYYKPAVPVNTLLKQGVASGAYLQNAGWTYKGLIMLGEKYGLDGNSYDLGKLSTDSAFTQFKSYLKDGPVIVSVHYKFDPKSTIPHLVVVDGIDDSTIYYNDPAAKTGEKQISTTDFLAAWKKRFIVMRPAKQSNEVALAL